MEFKELFIFYLRIKTVLLILASIAFFFLGMKLLSKKTKYTVSTHFTVQSVTPKSVNEQTLYYLKGIAANCGTTELTVYDYKFNIDVGETINVFIQPGCNNNDALVHQDNYKIPAILSIFTGVIMIVISYFIYNFLKK